ncbi:fungal-specific transcription factor domain-domain-containing protein [Microdochium bolleyi]|uniref:Fungal-specific transcription factor domain-domain-containing protein n=1 Tax=Microdochium bolleyi TaxID=196109 RepID=A0A136IQN4_9PEZI|nr:fungal-specific transcription factor domain-domain-containing protein [Microdochium bolleyi]
MDDDTDADSGPRPMKRRKVRLACRPCRDKKIRCDGGRPVCHACVRKKLDPAACVYAEAPPDLDVQYVRTLEDRIRDLERGFGQGGGGGHHHVAQGQQQHYHQQQQDLSAPGNHHEPRIVNDDSHAAAYHLVDLQSQGRQQPAGAYQATTTPSSIHVLPGGIHNPLGSPYRPTPPDLLSPGTTHSSSLPATRLPPQYRHRNQAIPRHAGPAATIDSDDQEGGDVMGAAEGNTPDEPGRGAVFLGPSSTAAFMREVQESSEVKHLNNNTEATSTTTPASTMRSTRIRSKREQEQLSALLDSVILPPRRTADRHLDAYWRLSHTLYPVLHKGLFMRRYEAAWSHSSRGDGVGVGLEGEPAQDAEDHPEDNVHSARAFHATLNILLALGCSYSLSSASPSPSSQPPSSATSLQTSAETFFDRSQLLLRDADHDRGSLSLVQAYILTAQYLQSRTDSVNKCWVAVGTAIRVAQGIGIQLDLRTESQAGRQERRRTWWCCLLLDRVLSMTLGRPPMVTWPTTIPMPAAVDDEELKTGAGSSCEEVAAGEAPSKTAFFVHTLRLMDVMMSVLKSLYRPFEELTRSSLFPSSSVETLSLIKIVELEAELARWRRDVPSYLRYHELGGQGSVSFSASSGGIDAVFLRQAIALHCRYLHLRILLFRPMMMHLSQHGSSQVLESDFQRDSLADWGRAAMVVLDLL